MVGVGVGGTNCAWTPVVLVGNGVRVGVGVGGGINDGSTFCCVCVNFSW